MAIIGPNGSGKSTLLKLLMRFLYPSVVDGVAGTVRIFGHTEWNVWELRSRLGFASAEIDQHFTIGRSGRLTAMEAVLTGFSSSELEVDASQISEPMRAAARGAMAVFGLHRIENRRVGVLSTGERRRVLLARAIVRHPSTLILDEPTAGLDLFAQRQLLDEIQALADSGTTIVLVTHHIEEILPCIERVILLDQGTMAFDGPTPDGLQSLRISQLFGCQVSIHRSESGYYSASLGQ